MAVFRHVPEMIDIGGEWMIVHFEPMQPAFKWEKVKGKTGTLYVLSAGTVCKIGMTTDLPKRFNAINSSSPMPLEIVATRGVPLAGLAYAEAWLHQRFSESRLKGEWFNMDWHLAASALDEAAARADAYAQCCKEWHSARYGKRKVRKPRNPPSVGLSPQELDAILASPGVLAALDSLATTG
jgi:hypothetical protein